MLSEELQEGVANPLALSKEEQIKLAFQDVFAKINPDIKVLYVDLEESQDAR